METKGKLLTLDQLVELLGYKRSTILKMTSAGHIPYSKPHGKNLFFDRDEIEKWALSKRKSSLDEKISEAASHVVTH